MAGRGGRGLGLIQAFNEKKKQKEEEEELARRAKEQIEKIQQQQQQQAEVPKARVKLFYVRFS